MWRLSQTFLFEYHLLFKYILYILHSAGFKPTPFFSYKTRADIETNIRILSLLLTSWNRWWMTGWRWLYLYILRNCLSFRNLKIRMWNKVIRTKGAIRIDMSEILHCSCFNVWLFGVNCLSRRVSQQSINHVCLLVSIITMLCVCVCVCVCVCMLVNAWLCVFGSVQVCVCVFFFFVCLFNSYVLICNT